MSQLQTQDPGKYIFVALNDGTKLRVDTSTNETTVQLPTGQVVTNVDGLGQISKGEQTGSKIMGIGGAIATASTAAGPAAPLVAAVGAVVGAIGGLIKLFSGGRAQAKALAAQRAEYEKVNAQLTQENAQLASEIQKLEPLAVQLKQQIKNLNIPLGLSGLGICIFNCKKKKEEKKLNATVDVYNALVAEQQELIEIAERATNEIASLFQIKTDLQNKRALLIGGGLLLLAGGVWWFKFRKNKK